MQFTDHLRQGSNLTRQPFGLPFSPAVLGSRVSPAGSVVASLREVSTGHPQPRSLLRFARCPLDTRNSVVASALRAEVATGDPQPLHLWRGLYVPQQRPCLPLWGRWHAPTRFPAKQKRQKRVTEEVSSVTTNRTPTVSAGIFAIGFRLRRTAIFVLGCQSILTFFFRLVKQIGWPFSSAFAILYENEREVLI